MIGMRIFEANIFHWVAQLDPKSLCADYCRLCANLLHTFQRELQAVASCYEIEFYEDCYNGRHIMRRLEIHFSKRAQVIDAYWFNRHYGKQYTQERRP